MNLHLYKQPQRGPKVKLAAIFNFIDSTIRILPQDEQSEALGMVNSDLEDRKIQTWQKDVVSSIANDASTMACDPPPALTKPPPPLVVNQIVTSPRVVVTRVAAPEPKHSDEISTKAIIGTVVGATAGAFIAYAMVKGDSENHQQPRFQERITYRTVDIPPQYELGQSRPITRVPIQDTHSRYGSFADGNHEARALAIGPLPPRAETLVPHSNPQSSRAASQKGSIMMIDKDRRSYAASGRNTVVREGLAHPPPSAPVTEVRMARDIPFPPHSQPSQYSRATSVTVKNRAHTKAPMTESREKLLPSLAPRDSISQVSTRVSRDSARLKRRHSSHHGRSKTGSRSQKDHEDGGASKAGSKHHSKVGNMVEDVVNIIKGTSIKDSEHRSKH